MLKIFFSPNTNTAINSLAENIGNDSPEDILRPRTIFTGNVTIRRSLAQQMSLIYGAEGTAKNGIFANFDMPLSGLLLTFLLNKKVDVANGSRPWGVDSMAWELFSAYKNDHPIKNFIHINTPNRAWNSIRKIVDDIDRAQMHRPDVAYELFTEKNPEQYSSYSEISQFLLKNHSEDLPPVLAAKELIADLDNGLDLSHLITDKRPLMLFGLLNIPALNLSLIRAVAKNHPVMWWVNTPLSAVVENIFDDHTNIDNFGHLDDDGFIRLNKRIIDAEDGLEPVTYISNNPLVQTNGREVIEGLGALKVLASNVNDFSYEILGRKEGFKETLLGSIKKEIVEDTEFADDSYSVNETLANPSVLRLETTRRSRQVDVLRDEIIRFFDRDPSLQPRDIVVVCSDITKFEPYIRKSFALLQDREGNLVRPNLRIKIINPNESANLVVVDFIAHLLSLSKRQITRTELLSTIKHRAVVDKICVGDFDYTALKDYLAEANFIWGLDDNHRSAYFDIEHAQFLGGTLKDTVEQLIVGSVLQTGGVGDVGALPVRPGHLELIGRFTDFAEKIKNVIYRCLEGNGENHENTLDEWLDIVSFIEEEICDQSISTSADRRGLKRLFSELSELSKDSAITLALDDFIEVFKQTTKVVTPRADIASGDLIMTSLSNARGIDYKVVFILGMDEDLIPRSTNKIPSELWGDERIGDRDSASADRQAWLDAIAGTAEHLISLWSVEHDGDNPSILLSSWNDIIKQKSAKHLPRSVTDIQKFGIHSWSVTEHTNQDKKPLDRYSNIVAKSAYEHSRNQVTDTITADARMRNLIREEAKIPEELSVYDLYTFVRNPLNFFAKHTLGLGNLDCVEKAPDETIPVYKEGLGEWGWKRYGLEHLGLSKGEIIQELRRGKKRAGLPYGAFAHTISMVENAQSYAMRYHEKYNISEDNRVDIVVDIPIVTEYFSTRIIDVLPVYKNDNSIVLLEKSASSLKESNFLPLWFKWVIVSYILPEYNVLGVLVYSVKDSCTKMSFYKDITINREASNTTYDFETIILDLLELMNLGVKQPLLITETYGYAHSNPNIKPGSRKIPWNGSFFLGFEDAVKSLGSFTTLIGKDLPYSWMEKQTIADVGLYKELAGKYQQELFTTHIWSHINKLSDFFDEKK